MRSTCLAAVVLLTLIALSCENPTDLGGTLEPKMVAYSVLSTFSDTQYVRIIQTVSQNALSGDYSVKDAAVEITDGVQTFSFHDTVITHLGAVSALDSFHVYVCYAFKPLPNTVYSLHATSPTLGVVNAQTKAPAHTTLDIDRSVNFILRNPYASHTVQPEIAFPLSPGTAAYQVHVEIEYEDQTPTGTFIKRFEVPERMITVSCFAQIFNFVYPSIVRPGTGTGQITYRLSAFSYRKSVEFIENIYTYNFRLMRVIFTVVQFNDEWYRYFRSARLDEDRFSVRLDEPDYSNISGGLGLFGGFVVDTVSTAIPSSIFNPNPQNTFPDCN